MAAWISFCPWNRRIGSGASFPSGAAEISNRLPGTKIRTINESMSEPQ